MREHTSYLRDIIQAYLQQDSSLDRNVYMRVPAEMVIDDYEIMLLRKPLLGISESGLQWFVRYHGHHIETNKMNATRIDPCLLYPLNADENKTEGVNVLQVDDSYRCVTEEVLKDEDKGSRKFKSKPNQLVRGDTAICNGAEISIKTGHVHILNQGTKLRRRVLPNNQQELVITRAQAQYIGCCTRPDICSAVQMLGSSMANPTRNTFNQMKEVVALCHNTADVGLKFIPMDQATLKLALFTDA